MVNWPDKDPGENKLLRFQFANQLEVGELLTGLTVEVIDQAAVDPAPTSILAQAATIAGSDVVQPVSGGLNGAKYYFKVFATTSAGRRHMIDAILPVTTYTGL